MITLFNSHGSNWRFTRGENLHTADSAWSIIAIKILIHSPTDRFDSASMGITINNKKTNCLWIVSDKSRYHWLQLIDMIMITLVNSHGSNWHFTRGKNVRTYSCHCHRNIDTFPRTSLLFIISLINIRPQQLRSIQTMDWLSPSYSCKW